METARVVNIIYKYETHCHTAPVSKCGKASAEETVRFYKQMGYDGIFISNHFLDGNINPDVWELPYSEQIDYYFSDFDKGAAYGAEIGLKVFPAVELSYKGTDFLIYGLEKEWYRAHPEILNMKKTEELAFMMKAGAFVIQAHPYREEHYIDHIRLFPRSVHGVEVINSGQKWESNLITPAYAKHYGLLETCGSDNHWGSGVFDKFRERGYRPEMAGMSSEIEINSVSDFIGQVRNGMMHMFLMDEDGTVTIIADENRQKSCCERG